MFYVIIFMKRCLECNKEFVDRPNKNIKFQKKFCSHSCCARFNSYLNHNRLKNDESYKAKKIIEFKKWYSNTQNKIRHNKNIKRNYYKHKDRWKSRSMTYSIVRGIHGFKQHPLKKSFCKKCDSNLNLTIHHQIYPITTKEIIEAIDKEQIYYLCSKCHTKNS